MSACGPFYSMRNLRLITDKPVVWDWFTERTPGPITAMSTWMNPHENRNWAPYYAVNYSAWFTFGKKDRLKIAG